MIAAFLILALLAVFVWPTQYRRSTIGKYPMREHRFTGKAEIYIIGSGWTEYKNK